MPNLQNIESQVSGLTENVRHNEKGIDRLDLELKQFRSEVQSDFKGVRSDIKALTDNLQAVQLDLKNFQIQFYGGVAIILVANVVLKFWPS